MKYHFQIHKEGDGFWAQCLELEGCVTQADSREELGVMMEEALNLYLDESPDSEEIPPFPLEKKPSKRSVVEVPVDPQIACAFFVRYFRKIHGLTQKEVARLLGFKNVYSYQRLESSQSNPTLKILIKLKQIFPEFSLDETINC